MDCPNESDQRLLLQELLDRKQPYDNCAEFQVPLAIQSGQLPSISGPFLDQSSLRKMVKQIFWDICQSCWIREPEDRATIDTILPGLEKEIKKYGIPILRSYFYDDEGEDPDTKERRTADERYSLAFLESIAD